jgi:phosphoenolpyruvate phosphomutase
MIFEKAKKLRTKIASSELLIGIGARDALDAKLIENAGFDFVWSSSLGISAAYAVPDASLISMKQYLEAARAMNEVIAIPVIMDADTGYGNVNNVIYAAKLIEEAGIAGMSIEDKKFPKDNSLLAGGRQELISIDEFSGKIRAAKENQKNKDFLVIARVEALIAGWGQEEALRRASAYSAAGADFILIHSKQQTPEEIEEFIRRWNGSVPLVLVPTNYPQFTEEKILATKKVKLVIYANQIFRAAIKAEELILRKIKISRGIHSIESFMVSVQHLFEIQNVSAMKQNESKYLPQKG